MTKQGNLKKNVIVEFWDLIKFTQLRNSKLIFYKCFFQIVSHSKESFFSRKQFSCNNGSVGRLVQNLHWFLFKSQTQTGKHSPTQKYPCM